jgi:hypothetical protein
MGWMEEIIKSRKHLLSCHDATLSCSLVPPLDMDRTGPPYSLANKTTGGRQLSDNLYEEQGFGVFLLMVPGSEGLQAPRKSWSLLHGHLGGKAEICQVSNTRPMQQ